MLVRMWPRTSFRLRTVPLAATLLCALSVAPAAADEEDGGGSFIDPLLEADRGRSHLDPTSTGVWFSLSPEAGVVARDPVLGGSARIGFEHPLFALHLRAPMTLRPLDLPPSDVHPSSPMPCAFVRCAEWIDPTTGQFSIETLARLVDEVRVGHRGDVFHLRAGALRARLGEGGLVDGVWTAPAWDTRRVGAFVDVGLPSRALVAEAFIGDVMRAADLTAGRVTVRPTQFLPGAHDTLWPRFFDRMALSVEAAADFGAPSLPYDRLVSERSMLTFAPLVGGNATASVDVLEENFFVGVRPFLSASVLYGLTSEMSAARGDGGGTAAGATVSFSLPYVGVRATTAMTADTPYHRHGVFGALYMLERDRTLPRDAFAKNNRSAAYLPTQGVRDVPARGGIGGLVDVELAVHEWLRTGARVRFDPTSTGNTAEGYVEASAFGARLASRVVTRGFTGALVGFSYVEAPHAGDLGLLHEQTICALDLAVPIWGPFSFTTRVLYAPRVAPTGFYRFDPDVLFGVSSDLVVDSPVFDWL